MKDATIGWLFQARLWREYAQAWDGRLTTSGVGRYWVEQILKVPRDECIARARNAVVHAARINRARDQGLEAQR